MGEDAVVAPKTGPPAVEEGLRQQFVRDIAYATVVLDEARRLQEVKRSPLGRLGKLLSHGLVLLLLGSGLTSVLVPWIQRRHQEREARIEARKDCLTQFLLYSNSRWPEYYLIVPLVVRGEVSADEYRESLRRVTEVKVARYDAAAKIEARLLAYRTKVDVRKDDIEDAFEAYKVRVNELSGRIDAWLRNAYCYSNVCESYAAAALDPGFDPYAAFTAIQQEVIELVKVDATVAELLVKHLEDD